MIKSDKEAQEYLNKVHKKLDELIKFSQEAEAHTHAGLWLGIKIAFYGPISEIEAIEDMMKIYVKSRLGMIEDEEKDE